ncbi:MAG: hypothetical protein FWF69_10280 [Firmicutes bacterium]|nr:hypothetical protein [Bacillota bacterium]
MTKNEFVRNAQMAAQVQTDCGCNAPPPPDSSIVEVCYKKCKPRRSPCVCLCKAVLALLCTLFFGLGVVAGALLGQLSTLIVSIVGGAIALISLLLLIAYLISSYCSGCKNPCSLNR